MIAADELLAALQRELRLLIVDLNARVSEQTEVRTTLEGEWKKAFDAQRTGRTFESWLEDRLTQVGVGWLLACVFVRFCEDNELIAEPRVAGPTDRGMVARAAQQKYFASNPHASDREYLQQVFRDAADLPGLHGLLAEGQSALWLVDPPADACTRVINLLRSTRDDGSLVYDFGDAHLGTRFLGDLYQDLSEQAQKDYALLQTPDFVEEFILDRTLNPAIETFGLAKTTIIDPTCGSGHFLLGAFERILTAWTTAEPNTSIRELAQRSLNAVTGVDLNPFAAAVAHFRLLVSALRACDITDLRNAPDFSIDVATGDSLLWGAAPGTLGMEIEATTINRQFLYRTEHMEDLQRVFRKRYAAVVGNPPYIVCRDAVLNQQYRDRFGSCYRQYSLGVPFTERFFDLATTSDGMGTLAGYVGMITSNSFMKREFGKKLVESYIPEWDITHVIDTAGAFIPGHGTPTVILFGRNQRPVSQTVRTAMGIRSEPFAPRDPARGLVWSAITAQIDHPGSECEFLSVADTERSGFAKHPWIIGGGGAAELKVKIDEAGVQLRHRIDSIGSLVYTRCDDAYLADDGTHRRFGIEPQYIRHMVEGSSVRDWCLTSDVEALFPYDGSLCASASTPVVHRLWPLFQLLIARREINGTQLEIGLAWYEYNRFLRGRFRSKMLIAFSNIATHNHFVLNRGETVFNAHAPVIRLSESATIDDYLRTIGPLNSSVACFWMQQVFHNKGRPGADTAAADERFEHRYEFDGTKLQQLPLPDGDPPIRLASALDLAAKTLGELQPASICKISTPTRGLLDAARTKARELFASMIACQEELDWECLSLYGLTPDPVTVPEGFVPPGIALGERAFEIVLARQVLAGEVKTAWFTRHDSSPITEMPTHWPDWYCDVVQRRIDLIERDLDVALIERPEHKRRWATEPWQVLESAALRIWLLDRLEGRSLWFEGSADAERAICRSIAQLADRVGADEEFMGVARLWKDAVEVDAMAIVAELVADEYVPAQSSARYKASGIDKRRQWEQIWKLQQLEDQNMPLPDGLSRIPLPPKYASVDFQKSTYWQARGKLDVPKERFVSIANAERDSDATLVLAWAGFDHEQLSQAIATVLHERQSVDGWDAERCWPIVVALGEQLFWLDLWHSAIDARWGQSPASLYRSIAEQAALSSGHTLAEITQWQPPVKTRVPRKPKKATT